MDEGQKIYPQYGATKTPMFLLDSKRVVKYIGSIDDSPTDASAVKAKYLEDAIAALQAGKDIIPNVTKSTWMFDQSKKPDRTEKFFSKKRPDLPMCISGLFFFAIQLCFPSY